MLPHLDGHDTDVFALLLRLRYAQDFNVSVLLTSHLTEANLSQVDEGTLTIRDAQVELMNERNYTLYGLSTMEHCLKAFLAQPMPSQASHDAKLRAHAFGLVTLAKFIIRLPADILEEELPKIKLTLTDVCSPRSLHAGIDTFMMRGCIGLPEFRGHGSTGRHDCNHSCTSDPAR
jgi:CLIP-associating protein 1/2